MSGVGYEMPYDWAIYHVPGDNEQGFYSNTTITTDEAFWEPDATQTVPNVIKEYYYNPRPPVVNDDDFTIDLNATAGYL